MNIVDVDLVDMADWIDTYEAVDIGDCRPVDDSEGNSQDIQRSGASVMTPILILKAFGHLPSTDLIESERERERREWVDPPTGAVKVGILHRAFEARAEVMGWAATSRSITLPRPLWNMFEAGLVDSEDDPSLIGWVYVGMANSIDLSKQPPAPQPGTGAGWAAIQMPPGYAESTVALPVALPQFVQCLDDAT